jgi:MMP 1-O-methyltransferase
LKELETVYALPGMLTHDEVDCLYHLGQINQCDGVIVEIGSWQGKSTIALALGAAKADREKIYAIDPHAIQLEEGYLEDTRFAFMANIRQAGIDGQVIPMIMTSKEAARDWSQPIRLLWIDGDHRYESVKQDFLLWEPFVAYGGIIAMHDTIRKKGPKKVLWKHVFRSCRFQEIAIVDNITAARKVRKTSLVAMLRKWLTIVFRGIYIGARKARFPRSKPVGRLLLKKWSSQIWLPGTFFIFSESWKPDLAFPLRPLEPVKLIFQSERT